MGYFAKHSAEQIAKFLDPKAKPNLSTSPPWWNLRCPTHDDTDPSFGLRVMEDGYVRVSCRAGCTDESVYAFLEREDQIERRSYDGPTRRRDARGRDFPDDAPEEPGPNGLPPGITLEYPESAPPQKRSKYVAHWTYRTGDGRVFGHVVRYEPTNGGKKKIVPYFRQDARGQWGTGIGTEHRIPFALDRLRSESDGVVYVVEGERCAQTLLDAGVLATTWHGGSSVAKKCDWGYLHGREVIIWPDNDAPGLGAAVDLVKAFGALDCKVSVIDVRLVPELSEVGADVVEFFAAGKTPEDVRNLPVRTEAVDVDAEIYPYSDLGNARRLLRLFDGNLRYVEESGWWSFQGGLWRNEAENRAVRSRGIDLARTVRAEASQANDPAEAKEALAWWKKCHSLRTIDAATGALKSQSEVWGSPEDFDADDHLLCCRNGYVDLRTGELRDHDRDRMMTRMCNASYRPEIESSRFLDFLFEIFGGDEELVQYMLSIIGYSLTGSVAEEVFFILYGVGKNGKSKLIEALTYVFGGYARSSPSDLLLKKERGGIPNDIARLQNVRMVVTNETSRGEELDEARVKEITGGDMVSARFLHKEYFDFNPKFKLWLRTNHLPQISGGDEGIWRRILTIPFNVEIAEAKRDRNIMEKLKADADAILTLGVKYAKQWYATGLPTAKAVTDEVGRYREQMDHFASWMTECCYVNRENDDMSEMAATLLASYQNWTRQNDIPSRSKIGKNLFSKELVQRKFRKQHTSKGTRYVGVQLREHELKRIARAAEQSVSQGHAGYHEMDGGQF